METIEHYRCKEEVSVLSNMLAANCTKKYPGLVSELEIFQRNVNFHKVALKETAEEWEFVDIGRLSGENP